MQGWETEPLSIYFRYVIAVLGLEFEDLRILNGLSSIFKELGAGIEADLLVLTYCYQPILIAIGNIDQVNTVLQCRLDRIVILDLDLELARVDNLLVLSLVLDKRDLFLRLVQESVESLLQSATR